MNNASIDRYAQLCRQEILSFLDGELMCCDPLDMDDAEIILGADARSRWWTHDGAGFLSQSAQFCSLLAVDGEGTEVYENMSDQRFVEILRLHPMNLQDGRTLSIPFSHFQYPMMLDKGIRTEFDERKAGYVCLLDDLHDKESILERCGGLVLYSYHLGGITKFGQHRNLYRMTAIRRETLADSIRRELVRSQAASIEYLYRYPEYCKPDISGRAITLEQANAEMRNAVKEFLDRIEEKRSEIARRVSSSMIKTERI